MEYPDSAGNFPPTTEGPALSRTKTARKCVACFLPGILPTASHYHRGGELNGSNVEKYPVAFDIDMLRCIYCGFAKMSVQRRPSS